MDRHYSFVLAASFYAIVLRVTFAEHLTNPVPVVDLPTLGKIKGTISASVDGHDFFSFMGVPYAAPPVGENRFKEPQPLESWKGLKKANKVHKCMQYVHLNLLSPPSDPVVGSEDCLYLNIYTPTLRENANLDVIVYIHGGAFMFSYSGFYGPKVLMNQNVVLITINYRLGPMGFLSTEDDVVPGNNGLKDQIAAFKWIQRYIKYFGGNSNSVTITGNSAGGASVHLHYMIKESRGLFHKGFSQSGSALNPWVLMEKPLEKTKKVASIVKCKTENTKQMIECMKKAKGRKIVQTVKSFQPWLYNPFTTFGPVVDSWSSRPLLEEHPYEILKKGDLYNVTWVASHVYSEGLYPAAEYVTNQKYLPEINKKWNKIMPFILHCNDTLEQDIMEDTMQKIRSHYFGEKEVSNATFNELVQLIGDRLFIVDMHKAAKLHARANVGPVYMYYFTYRGFNSRSVTRAGTRTDFGASHGDDVSYLLQMNLDMISTKKDREMSDFFVEMWTSVAQSGKPDIPSWKPIDPSSENTQYLKISSPDNVSMEDATLGHPEFWNSIPFKENENLSN